MDFLSWISQQIVFFQIQLVGLTFVAGLSVSVINKRRCNGCSLLVVLQFCVKKTESLSRVYNMMQFTDGGKEVELKLRLKTGETLSPKDISVDADGTCLAVKEKRNGLLITLLETNQLFDKIRPSETIWLILKLSFFNSFD